MRQTSVGLLFLFALPITSCRSSTEVESVPVCQPGVTLSISGGVEPTFSWAPHCRATALGVESIGSHWAVIAPGDGLLPPIRYGQVPRGALDLGFPGGPLSVGTEYTVRLERSRSSIGRDTVAQIVFVP